LVISARATASICCSPPESVAALCCGPLAEPREQRARRFSSVHGWARPSRFAAVATRFSRTVRFGKICRPSGTSPTPSRAIRSGVEAERGAAREGDRAAERRNEAHDGPHRGRLAHAVAAEQRDHLAVADLERHVEQHLALAVGSLKGLDREHQASSSPR
jgi:hypothetical protein